MELDIVKKAMGKTTDGSLSQTFLVYLDQMMIGL
jgi:hypothetical protein